MNEQTENGDRSRYMCKMITLTAPGKEYRQRIPGNKWTDDFNGDHDPEATYREMGKALDKLIRALKKHYGDFHYIRVVESQRSGYPHFHIVMVGSSVIPKEILETIRKLWTHTYEMGNVDIQPTRKFKSVKHAVYYCMKYLDKEPAKYHQFSRVFTSSQKALVPNKKRKFEWEGYEVSLGYTGGKGEFEEILCQNQIELEKWIWKMNKFLMIKPWEYHKAHDEMRTKTDKRNNKSDKRSEQKSLSESREQRKLELKF